MPSSPVTAALAATRGNQVHAPTNRNMRRKIRDLYIQVYRNGG